MGLWSRGYCCPPDSRLKKPTPSHNEAHFSVVSGINWTASAYCSLCVPPTESIATASVDPKQVK